MAFWQNKSVLITGASGFVGSHLVSKLMDKNSKIITLSKKPSGVLERVASQELGSVQDFKKLKEIIKKYKVDIIFHLAAQPIVEVGQTDPIPTFEINIKGTWNVLEAARRGKVQKVIIASTAHVYGDNPRLPFKEEYFPQPSRPYETSKACADLLAQSFADTYNLGVEIPRFVNIYGPGDFNFSRLIPKVIRSILKSESPRVWDIGSIRDFLFIDDAINAYLLLAEKKLPNTKRGRVFNFGTGKPQSIVDLVQKLIAISKKESVKLKIDSTPEDRSNEIKKQYVSVVKAKRELGWVPQTSLEEGLEKTFRWYKENVTLFQ